MDDQLQATVAKLEKLVAELKSLVRGRALGNPPNNANARFNRAHEAVTITGQLIDANSGQPFAAGAVRVRAWPDDAGPGSSSPHNLVTMLNLDQGCFTIQPKTSTKAFKANNPAFVRLTFEKVSGGDPVHYPHLVAATGQVNLPQFTF